MANERAVYPMSDKNGGWDGDYAAMVDTISGKVAGDGNEHAETATGQGQHPLSTLVRLSPTPLTIITDTLVALYEEMEVSEASDQLHPFLRFPI